MHLTTTRPSEEKCTDTVPATHLGHPNEKLHQKGALIIGLSCFAQTVLRHSAAVFKLSRADGGQVQARARSFSNLEQCAEDLCR